MVSESDESAPAASLTSSNATEDAAGPGSVVVAAVTGVGVVAAVAATAGLAPTGVPVATSAVDGLLGLARASARDGLEAAGAVAVAVEDARGVVVAAGNPGEEGTVAAPLGPG
jgi:hypothetical protein